jgi:hypothetical protein
MDGVSFVVELVGGFVPVELHEGNPGTADGRGL